MATRLNPQTPIPRPVSTNQIGSRVGTPDPTTLNQLPTATAHITHLSTVASNADLHLKRVSQLPISQNLNKFDAHLNHLLHSVAKYQPCTTDAVVLLETEQELAKSIDDIITHQQTGLEIRSIESQSDQLDANCDKILKGLMECRKSLRSLQSVDSVKKERSQMQQKSISSDLLLQYAMKLAKFTRVPPTFDTNQIGPNNFIWPAEDSLRRGMLALASIKSDQLIGVPVKSKAEEKSNGQIEEKDEDNFNRERRGSFGASYGGGDDDDNAATEGVDDYFDDLYDMDLEE